MMRLGIDPGLTGGIALIGNENYLYVWPMPTMTKTHGKGWQVNARILADIMRDAMLIADEGLTVYIERVGAMPKQGVTSMFGFGRSVGVIDGIAATLGLPMVYPTPRAWKRRAGLIGKPKDASRTLVIERYPAIAHKLAHKKDVGIADAVLIAVFGDTGVE